jgi:hypothetical protein
LNDYCKCVNFIKSPTSFKELVKANVKYLTILQITYAFKFRLTHPREQQILLSIAFWNISYISSSGIKADILVSEVYLLLTCEHWYYNFTRSIELYRVYKVLEGKFLSLYKAGIIFIILPEDLEDELLLNTEWNLGLLKPRNRNLYRAILIVDVEINEKVTISNLRHSLPCYGIYKFVIERGI